MLTGIGNILRAARSPILGARRPFSTALGYGGVWASARFPRSVAVRTARVGDWTISYADATSLLVLLDDIALRGDYLFQPSREHPVVVDAGANIGIATLALKSLVPAARVVAIEPNPSVYDLLVRNIAQNGLTDVEVHHAALARTEGVVRLDVEEAHGGLRSRVAAQGGIEVPARRLSQLIDGPIDFLKLDVEGSEEDVLSELADNSRLRDVAELVVEYHHHLDDRPDRLSIVLALLEEHGFTYQLAVPRPRLDDLSAFADVLIHAARTS